MRENRKPKSKPHLAELCVVLEVVLVHVGELDLRHDIHVAHAFQLRLTRENGGKKKEKKRKKKKRKTEKTEIN
jgi:hypothetical protein